jgi:hypothetical protein
MTNHFSVAELEFNLIVCKSALVLCVSDRLQIKRHLLGQVVPCLITAAVAQFQTPGRAAVSTPQYVHLEVLGDICLRPHDCNI